MLSAISNVLQRFFITLQQIMGHSDLQVLRQYLALVEEDLRDAHQKHGAVDNML